MSEPAAPAELEINPAWLGSGEDSELATDPLKAIAAYQLRIASGDVRAETHYGLAVAHRSNAQPGLAIENFRHCIHLDPFCFEAHLDLGNLLTDDGEVAEGIGFLERALELRPGDAGATLGLIRSTKRLGDHGRSGQLLHQLEAAVEAAPEEAARHVYLGLGYCQLERNDDAVAALLRAAELNRDNPYILHLVGVVLEEVGRTREALAVLNDAVELAPGDAEIHFARSTALLRLGHIEKGFEEYEWRWRSAHFTSPRRLFAQPVWDGSPLIGRTIVLHTEQGFGDSIQFIRYAEELAKPGARVVVECEPSLERLFTRASGVSEVVVKGNRLPHFDVHAPLLSLPHLLRATASSIPAATPYFQMPPARSGLPARQPGLRLRIGIAWEGSRTGANFVNKSCPLTLFEPLLSHADVEIFSLQKGPGAEDLKKLGWSNRVRDLGSGFSDFYMTAEAVTQLDLVITVDTVVAHLAGALGVPTWVLLSSDSDWRWLLDREDSPWYPTARLFRQRSPRDWTSVFARVVTEVRAFGATPSAAATTASDMTGLVLPARNSEPAGEPAFATTHATTLSNDERLTPAADKTAPEELTATSESITMSKASNASAATAVVDNETPLPRLAAVAAQAKRHFDRAVEHQIAKRLVKAEAEYRRVLKLDPCDVEAHNNLGAVLCQLGNSAEGRRHFERAIELRPEYLDGHNNLGLLLISLRDFPGAISHFERALAADPNAREPLRNLTVALREAGNFAASEQVLSSAIHRHPNDPQLMGLLASALADQGRTADARAMAERTIALDPENYDSSVVLGNCAMEDLHVRQAIAYYDRAEQIAPDESSAPWNRAYARLLTGDFERGWKDYETRWRLLRVSSGDMAQYHERPRWDGTSLDGKSILLHAEQGFGDTIQFARYAALLRERWDVRVVLQCQPPLVDIMRTCPGIDEVVPRGSEAPSTDVQVAMLGLPYLLQTRLETIPAKVPYLTSSPTGIETMVDRGAKVRVGLIWAGNVTHGRDNKRSLHLGALEHLAAIPGVRLHSLQIGPQETELLTACYRDEIIDIGGEILRRVGGFSDTAAAIEALDVVVTVDTSVAHLAGALGKPVWVLLPYLPDWRWLLDRNDSPWYPSMRLFRQSRPGDWSSAVNALTNELSRLAGADSDHSGSVPLASAQTDEEGQPRFTLGLPLRLLADSRRFDLFEQEIAHGGAYSEARAFLDAKLSRNDLLVDVDCGIGLVSMSAATIPGRSARVVAITSDAEDARTLLANAAANPLTGTIGVHLAPAGSPPVDEMAQRPLKELSGGVFLHVGSCREAPGALEGASGLIEKGRLAAFVWPIRRTDLSGRIVFETLSALGFEHFNVVATEAGPELVPFEERTDTDTDTDTVISLSARYLAYELERQNEADRAGGVAAATDLEEIRKRHGASAPAASVAFPTSTITPAASRTDTERRLGVDWQIGAQSGWGVYGMNLALHCLRTGKAFPVLFTPPSLDGLSAEQNKDLERAFEAHRTVAGKMAEHSGEIFNFRHTLLRALGNRLEGSRGREIRAMHNVGVVFFEDTHFDAGALYRGRQFDRIIAGSRWNGEVLRASGLENVSVCLQGVDANLFFPGEKFDALKDRFVVFSGGKLEFRKGQDLVVAAFREFQKRHPDALLVTAWHNHWPQSMLEIPNAGHVRGIPQVDGNGALDVTGWLIQNGLPENSILDIGLAANADIGKVVRSSDVGLFPNRCEGGTNLVAMETMASGVPVILSANTGHLDLVGEDRCYPLRTQGVVPNSRHFVGREGWGESSVEEIVEALERAYTDRADAGRRAEAALGFITGLTWPNQIDALLGQVEDLI